VLQHPYPPTRKKYELNYNHKHYGTHRRNARGAQGLPLTTNSNVRCPELIKFADLKLVRTKKGHQFLDSKNSSQDENPGYAYGTDFTAEWH
jgi:hypothetical protein